jgi:hypothetical protein
MTWYIELLHRDGAVAVRLSAPERGSLRIGRALDNDLVLDDPYCAAYHARLEILADGSAQLFDMNTLNGVVNAKNQAAKELQRDGVGEKAHLVSSDEPYRLGKSLLRIRSSAWELPLERIAFQREVWPLALLGFVIVLSCTAWGSWLTDTSEKAPEYLYALAGVTAVLCLWSAMYAVFGRLVSGEQRFTSHLAIASIGFVVLDVVAGMLNLLAFSMSWLWPLRISYTLSILIVACVVSFHLRLADPRHWKTLRVGVMTVAGLAIVIPVAQLWVSDRKLTDIQTIDLVEYSALRIAKPSSVSDFTQKTLSLKESVDEARKKKDEYEQGDSSTDQED